MSQARCGTGRDVEEQRPRQRVTRPETQSQVTSFLQLIGSCGAQMCAHVSNLNKTEVFGLLRQVRLHRLLRLGEIATLYALKKQPPAAWVDDRWGFVEFMEEYGETLQYQSRYIRGSGTLQPSLNNLIIIV